MTEVEVFSGICGFTTKIKAVPVEKKLIQLTIDSDCPNISKVADSINTVNAYQELFGKADGEILTLFAAGLPHRSCPVPVAVLKAVEVAAGLALPKDVHITFA